MGTNSFVRYQWPTNGDTDVRSAETHYAWNMSKLTSYVGVELKVIPFRELGVRREHDTAKYPRIRRGLRFEKCERTHC